QLINTQIADSNLNHANLEGTGLEQEKDSQSQRVIKPVMAESSGTEPLTTDLDLQSAPLPKTILANQNSLVLPEQREPFVESNQPEIESSQLTADNNITEPNSITEPNNSGEPSSSDEPNNDKPNNSVEPEKTEFTAEESPIANRQFQAPTAKHLRQGELVLDGRQRFFFTSNSTSADGTPFFISAGARFGVTNNLELALAIQAVDSGSFDPLDFDSSVVSPNNYDIALELKQRIWKNSSNTQALSGVVSASGLRRKFVFSRNGTTSEVDGDGIVPALQLPFTIAVGNRLDLTVAPTVAFFQEDSAVFVPRTPIANPGSFGTTVGLTGAVSYRLGSRLLLWGNAFVPFTGNNSVNRSTGLPAKTVAFNSGIRYLVNPRLGLDVFATNTFGTLGPLALTADREELGLGVGLVAMPDFAPGNRNYPNNFREQSNQPDTQFTTDGLGFFDGGTVPDGKVLIHFQGGSQGVLTALRFGLIKDLEILAYLDYISGTVDESEQGFGVKLRLLNQAEGLPFTASAAVTFGLTNQTFVNFFNNNRDEFSNQGLNKGVPFLLAGEEGEVGKLFVATLSFPVQYQLNDQIAFWFTPIAGFAQRKGLEIGGFSLGGSVEVIQDVSVLAEIGANFFR
ncbi:MAG: hypothetical protein HC792_03425, partial [Acaryochloridaceae cyanobacterium CSU_5_19]|nr:hypothetical protein [Acaryochloridaceae cyanobacterium CSU_5_19]